MIRKSAILLLAIGSLISCAEPTKQEEEKQTENDSLKALATEPALEFNQKVFYPIPSPEQMLRFIKESGVAYSEELMQDESKVAQINDPNKLALNFGVYIADLAYAAAYQDKPASLKTYKVVKQIGADLNMEDMMSEETLKEVERNLENADSLSKIAGSAYYDAVDFLEKNGQQGKLALMSLGGWVESMYISLYAIESYQADSKAIQRIADQKITFGNLYTFLRKHQNKQGVEEAIASVQKLRSIFASLKEERIARRSKDAEGGKLVLSSGREISITKEQFTELRSEIRKLRTSITDPNH